MAEVVRFAPSPTGELHLGNARSAVLNWLYALTTGGAFILRLDDTDTARSEERFARQILADLDWLGIRPGRVERQSERLAHYGAAADRLRAAGLLYPAYETAEELDRKRGLQRARGRPPVYDRAALALSDADRARLEAEGRRPHFRFRLPAGVRRWDDLCRGEERVDLGSLSDPVLVREDGTPLYTFTSVVDDALLGVTTVIRGEDHVTNTGVQIALFEALGATPPRFAHHNLLVRADGEPLSKRDNPLSLSRLAADGYEPMAVASLAVLLGTSRPVEAVASMAELAARIRLSDVSRGPATFEVAELDRLNAALLHRMPYEAAAPWLRAEGADDPAFWATVRENLARRGEVRFWRDAWRGRLPPATADGAVLEAARRALPPEPWDETTFRGWTDAVRAATGAKGRALFLPLRLALTGSDHGPEMARWILLLGRDETERRLAAAAAHSRG
jgi:glutamyl-tRNA synthetase